MTKKTLSQKKHKILHENGTLNPTPELVKHDLFKKGNFFDPHDLVQLKYETIRAIKQEGCSIAKASRDFGFSRPTTYQLLECFDKAGLTGLLPKKRGPKHPRKFNESILQFIQEKLAADPSLKVTDLRESVEKHFGIKIHSCTLYRGWQRYLKKNARKRHAHE